MNLRFSFLALALLFGFVLLAQPGNPNAPVPLDGGITLLAAAGIGLGVKQLRQMKKNQA